MIEALESGQVFVNRPGPEENTGFHAGWCKSGIGGDDGLHGYELYSCTKTVYMSWDVSKCQLVTHLRRWSLLIPTIGAERGHCGRCGPLTQPGDMLARS